MEYRLEIYRPGSCDRVGSIKVFSTAAPFLPIRVGDLLNTRTWDKELEWPLLRVLNIEHLISETSSGGIDPSGTITHQVSVYTESVADNAETRCKSPGKV
jgi:hypothetical protein